MAVKKGIKKRDQEPHRHSCSMNLVTSIKASKVSQNDGLGFGLVEKWSQGSHNRLVAPLSHGR